MKRLFAIVVALLLAACAAAPSVNGQLKTGYDTVAAFVRVTTVSLERGRITAEQAEKAQAQAVRVRSQLDLARSALATCQAEPCNTYLEIMKGLQPNLYELERQLRAQQQGGAR